MSTGDADTSEIQTNNVPLELLLATYILTARDKEIDESAYKILLDSLDKILFFNKKENKIILNYNNKVTINIDKVQPPPKPKYASWLRYTPYTSKSHEYNYKCNNNIYISNLFINLNIPNINIELTINEDNDYNYNNIEFLLNCKNKENMKCRVVSAVMSDPIQIKDLKLQINDKLILMLMILLLGGDNISINNINNCNFEDKEPYKTTLMAISRESWESCFDYKEKIILEGYMLLPKCIKDIINKTIKLANNIKNKIIILSNKNKDYILNMLPNPKKDHINELINNARLKTFELITLRLLQQK